MAGRGCNLECVKGDDAGKDIIEFMGPVKIILVDQPKNLYMRKRFAAAAIVLAHMMMGATSMTVLYYTLSYQKDSALFASHIVLGTAGLQLCMPSGILALHKLAGSTAVLRLPHRPFEHFWLQCFAIICGVLSALASFFFGDFKITVHSVTGVAATSIAILNAIFGIIVYDYSGTRIDHTELGSARQFVYKAHKFLGMISFTVSSACFISGLLKETFVKWAPVVEIPYITVIFCVCYTLVVLYKPLREH
ncbi:uncharacterized protein LOC123711904 [Pieris brassicae]|uniref:uncharacterized protein LOC123711904 n=1 Tax=Pieris brassicae TaxID=7116 RepID=UPI001E65E371|nr:uncharacterized protein LOC123711904 [Pieris brassicae]